MTAHELLATTARWHPPLRLLAAQEPSAPWAARSLDEDVPPATLGDARVRRDELRDLLTRERAAAADFLLALADFDRRRGWERLGHASLFAFLTRELGLSSGAAQLRLSAARLLPRHPAVEAALRSGRLCISAVGQLARVLTVQNEVEVLPRFLGLSAREAAEVAAAVIPRAVAPRREVVTALGRAAAPANAAAGRPQAGGALSLLPQAGVRGADVEVVGPGRLASPPGLASAPALQVTLAAPATGSVASAPAPGPAPVEALHTYEVPGPTRAAPRTPAVEPLSADLRRLHLTVSKGFLDKVAAARTGLSHALPGATTEQVLEAALDILLARQAQRKGLGRRARRAAHEARLLGAHPNPVGDGAPQGSGPIASASPASPDAGPEGRDRQASTAPRPPRRPKVPAAIERAVRLRDDDRCQHPLDSGGVCGSTWQVELDHVVPLALGGATTTANLRCACRPHNQVAAEEALGETLVREARGARARRRR